MTAPVVVGVDGSVASRRAVRFASGEAACRGVPLRLVTAAEWRSEGYDLSWQSTPSPMIAPRSADPAGYELLDEAAELAHEVQPAVEVRTALRLGRPIDVLKNESCEANLLVVGTRGRNRAAELMVGSVALGMTARAQCPVAVVRVEGPRSPDRRSPADVVVGVDGGLYSAAALGVAFAEATARGAALLAVYGQGPTRNGGEGADLLARELAPWRERYPLIRVTEHVVDQRPAEALLETSLGAGVLVVGSRGRGRLAGAVLGSVSRAAVHHAACPVIVVPPVRARAAVADTADTVTLGTPPGFVII